MSFFFQNSKLVSDLQYAIAEYVALSGAKGRLQSELGKPFGIDAKAVFFNVKKLEVAKVMYVLVNRKLVSFSSSYLAFS